jgi:hypothetical protein
VAKKTTAKRTARKTTAPAKSINEQMQDAVEAERTARSCAYPGCSAREETSFPHPSGKDLTIPACNHHAPILEGQKDDGAGIEQLVNNYSGP